MGKQYKYISGNLHNTTSWGVLWIILFYNPYIGFHAMYAVIVGCFFYGLYSGNHLSQIHICGIKSLSVNINVRYFLVYLLFYALGIIWRSVEILRRLTGSIGLFLWRVSLMSAKSHRNASDDYGQHRKQEVYSWYMYQVATVNKGSKEEINMVVDEWLYEMCGTSSDEVIARAKKESEAGAD